MLKNNSFFIKNLKNIVLIGYSNLYNEIEVINKELILNTYKISSPSYRQNFEEKKNVKFILKIDKKINQYFKEKKLNKNNTLFISFGSRWIFNKQQIKNTFFNNLINFHGTRLPLDAGGAGFSWRIMRGDRLGSNLAHIIDEKIDAGPIISYEEYIFPEFCKKPINYELFYSKQFFPFYRELIKKIKLKKKLKLLQQNKSLGLYNPRLKTKINGWINWAWEAEDIYNFINSFDDPYNGASTSVNNKLNVQIKSVHLHKGEITSHPYSKGIVIRKNKNWIIVSLGGKHSLIVEKVFFRKKNILNTIKLGDRFITNIQKLNKSQSYRATYK